MLENLPENYRAVVFGASGGIGAAITAALAEDPRCGEVWAGSRTGSGMDRKRHDFRFNLTDESSIAAAADRIGEGGPVHLAVIATGLLHTAEFGPERSWRELDAAAMAQVFAVNTIGPAPIARHFLELVPPGVPAIFAALSARVGSIGDNRLGGWHSYRASKTALNMLIRNFAIELERKRKQAICVALHPGTVDTGLSQPFQRGVPEGKLFTPDDSARKLLSVLGGLGPADSGYNYAWDGQRIEW